MIIKNNKYYRIEAGQYIEATPSEIRAHLAIMNQKHNCQICDINPGGYCTVCGAGQDWS